MNKDSYLSQKISSISFVALLCVFAIHSGAGEIHAFISRYLASWAVPWFLIVSGYFFESSFRKYSQKEFWRRKAHSLLIPYLLWGILGFLVLNEGRWPEGIDQVLGVINTYPKYNQPLWFIRALLLYMGIMSLLYSALRERFHWLAKIMFIVITTLMVRYKFQVLMPSSPYYFFLGTCLTGRISQNEPVAREYCVGVLFAFVVMLAGVIWMQVMPAILEKNVYNLLVIPLIWILYDCVEGRCTIAVSKWASLTMFCYACHCPIYTFFVYRWYGNPLCAEWRNLGFIVVFVFAGLLVLLMANATKRYLPRLYDMLAGGR